MPAPTPFHPRTSALCTSYKWKDWAGFAAVRSYDHSHEPEYFAFREAAGLLDVSPLFKYEVYGPDAGRFLARMMARDAGKLSVGRVAYTCWCDDEGKVVDDGTVTRLEEEYFRVTAADPSLAWMQRLAPGYRVTIEDSSERLAALAVQGPASRDVLKACADADLDRLKFFRATRASIGGASGWITRTGYTGDLGFEVWVESADALATWDAIMDAGRAYGLLPAGLDALDMTRIEAGFILLGCDYYSSRRVVLESRKSTPDEIGLGWIVELDREPFVGQAAIRAERARGAAWALVGLEASWPELEALYESYGLPPALPAAASREALPVFAGDRQVGRATSHTWSPILKRSLSLASVRAPWATLGTALTLEHTVEFERKTVAARVVATPFFDPVRKKKP